MPYILKNKKTQEIYSCKLINIYDLEYHGLKFWEDLDQAESDKLRFLQEHGIEPAEDWEIAEIETSLLKLGNVRLNNISSRKLFLNEQGKPEARESQP